MQARATILSESERLVDEDLLQDDEHVRAADMPPREIRDRPRWMGDSYTAPPG